MPLHISQFKIKQVIFRVNYRDAYFLFDRTGALFEAARKRWPTIKIQSGKPKVSIFLIDDKYRLQVELDRTTIVAYNPKSSLEDFIVDAHHFEEIVRKTLEIIEYKRVGFKPIYHKEYKTKEDATKDIIASLGLKVPQGKHFNIEGRIPLITLEHRWEDELLGISSELRSQEQFWEFNPPGEAEGLELKKVNKSFIKYAPDYYTLKSLSVSKFNTKKWLENAFHLIKRDSKIFLEK